jgi:hypothetical protein
MFLTKSALPAVLMNCGPYLMAFVTEGAKGLGSLADSSSKKFIDTFLQKFGATAEAKRLNIDEFVANNPDVRYWF